MANYKSDISNCGSAEMNQNIQRKAGLNLEQITNRAPTALEAVLKKLISSATDLSGAERAAVLVTHNPNLTKTLSRDDDSLIDTNRRLQPEEITYLVWSNDQPTRIYNGNAFDGFIKLPSTRMMGMNVEHEFMALSNYFALDQELPIRGLFPLKLQDGECVGALALLSEKQISLTTTQIEAVTTLSFAFAAVAVQRPDVQMQADNLTHIRNVAITNTRTAMVITDVQKPDNPIIFANPMFFEMTGYSESEVYGNNCRFLRNQDKDQPGFTTIRNAVQMGQECCVQIRNYKKDGTMFLNELTLTPIRSESGELTHFMGSQRDITRQRQEESRQILDQKMASIGHLAAGIAHEINSPLQFVGNNTNFLKQSFDGLFLSLKIYQRFINENCIEHPGFPRLRTRIKQLESNHLFGEVPEAIAQTASGIERITNIVKTIKYFSHPGSTDFVETNLRETIPATVALCKHEWKYVAEVEIDFQENFPNIWSLPGDLNQVVLNLIVNASHSIGDRVKRGEFEKGQIKVKLTFDERKCSISVSDTGDGIPPQVRESLFEPFVTTKSIGQGTGQGLAISRHIIHNKLQGTLSFETETGCGTTFLIQIPIGTSERLHHKQSAA